MPDTPIKPSPDALTYGHRLDGVPAPITRDDVTRPESLPMAGTLKPPPPLRMNGAAGEPVIAWAIRTREHGIVAMARPEWVGPVGEAIIMGASVWEAPRGRGVRSAGSVGNVGEVFAASERADIWRLMDREGGRLEGMVVAWVNRVCPPQVAGPLLRFGREDHAITIGRVRYKIERRAWLMP